MQKLNWQQKKTLVRQHTCIRLYLSYIVFAMIKVQRCYVICIILKQTNDKLEPRSSGYALTIFRVAYCMQVFNWQKNIKHA